MRTGVENLQKGYHKHFGDRHTSNSIVDEKNDLSRVYPVLRRNKTTRDIGIVD